MSSAKRSSIVLLVLCLIIFAIMTILNFYYLNNSEGKIVISHDSGIYEEDITITIDSSRRGKIYYTTDGTMPDSSNENAFLYEEPICLPLKDETTVYTLQFCCFYNDEEQSDVYRRDYILDSKGSDRFTTTYVVSIQGNQEELFGYEEGILVRGRVFDEFMAANPNVDIYGAIIPANYWSDNEVPVHMTVFGSDGQELIKQNCGMKVYGNVTRSKNQKSFRLISRYEYGDVNEFSYAFLPNLVSEEGNMPISNYQRLSFHNAGNDNGYAFMRTEFIGELSRQAGFQDVLVAETAAVYINGQYQGFYWLENAFDDRYFNERYGDYDGEMVVCEGTLSQMKIEEAETDLESTYVEEYNEFCQWLQGERISDDQVWEKVCDTIDVQNFAEYMAIEYYVGNIDWPTNNVKVYKYHSDSEEYIEDSVFDGKYRYLLFDTDYGLGLKFLGYYGFDAFEPRLYYLCSNTTETNLFSKLMKRAEFRELFINAVLNLRNGSFAPENALQTLQEYKEAIYSEVSYMMEETDVLKNSLWESDDNGIENVEIEIEEIAQYLTDRVDFVLDEIGTEWNCGEKITLTTDDQACGLMINGYEIEEDYTGTFFADVPVTIACQEMPGQKITGYYFNDRFMEGEEVTLSLAEVCNAELQVEIRVCYEIEEVESLEIVGYAIDGKEDVICIRNNGQLALRLSDYCISDSPSNTSRGRLPDVQLMPGEEYYIYGKSYTGKINDNGTMVAFGWTKDEPILLCHKSKGLMDQKN